MSRNAVRMAAAAVAALIAGVTALPWLVGTGPRATAAEGDARDAGTEVQISAEAEAYAARVTYDIPLPIGTGSVAHVVGEVRRSPAGENAKGLAAAPTHLDAVIGGTYADPDPETKGDERNLPQVECFYPGALLDTAFAFPTDTQDETAGLPATSFATARCGAGPEVELHSRNGPLARAEALIRPVRNAVEATTSVRAVDLSFLDGAVSVGQVEVSGASRVTGQPGGEHTGTRVTLTDVDVAGVRFSVADDTLVVAGQPLPIGSPAAQNLIDGANAALAASGCRVDVLTTPDRYPQGFLFSRSEPPTGTAADGTFAASYRAGLLVLCDIPHALTSNLTLGNTQFSPQRVQIVVGFAYTAATATEAPGGFGVGDLGGDPSIADPLPAGEPGTAADPVAASFDLAAPPAGPVTPPGHSVAPPTAAGAASAVRDVALDPGARLLLAIVSLVVWAALTHVGLRRLRGVTAE